ncbi:MAG: chromosomal replication initiator protein DnaA [Pseudobdellovibrionaceae bacterium]
MDSESSQLPLVSLLQTQQGSECISMEMLELSKLPPFNEALWSQAKSAMKQRNESNRHLGIWLDPITLIEAKQIENRMKIKLGVPNALHHYYVVENLQDKIYQEISAVYQASFVAEFVVIAQTLNSHAETVNPFHEALKTSSSQLDSQKATGYSKNSGYSDYSQTTAAYQPINSYQKYGSDPLNSDYSFSTFVVGKNSEFAHAACFNVSKSPGLDDYNPLVIYGPVGMGKTHLLQAAGNYIRENYPDIRITYMSAERFLNECVSALRRQEMEKFRQKYRENSDILLVDDLQYIGRGDAVKEEFFHTINSFIERKKQVILATDRMPKDIIGLEDRSRTRLERGLIVDITMPDLETRIAILRYKAEKLQIRLSEEVVHHIAKISKRSIRELEGNLKKVKMFSEFQGLPIDIQLTKSILVNHESQSTISVEEIQKIVADHFKVKVVDLKSATRAKPIVVPRQIAMFLIKKNLDRSLVEIGKHFGGKDHTTVMNALSRVQSLRETDRDINKDIEELETVINNLTGV